MSDQGGDTRIELMFRLEAALKRIEALEAEVSLWQSRVNDAADIIEGNVARIEQLKAALREIKDQYLTPDQSSAIAKAALDPGIAIANRSSPPKAST